MHFIFSNEVVLLFDFWSVHSPADFSLSILLLRTLLYNTLFPLREIMTETRGTCRGSHWGSGMALSVLVVLLLAVLYESIKVGKAKLLYQAAVSMPIPTSQLTEETDQDSSGSDSPPVSRTHLRWFFCHFGQSLIHVVQVVIGYFMMLAVMSYNTWIFFGVILGSAVGYYLAYPLLGMV